MTSKRILALSITSAMVLAACQQPTPAPVVASPTVTNVVANPGTVTQGANVSTTVTFSTTNGGGAISSAKANLSGVDTTCNLASGSTSNYTCNVPVPSSLGTGTKNITVTVVNNAPSAATATGSTSVTVNAAPINNPSFTATVNPSTVTVGQSAILTIADAVAGSGTISSISTSLNGGAAVTCTNLTGNGNCTVVVPAGTPLGAASLVVTTTNSAGGVSTRTVAFNVAAVVVNNPTFDVAGPSGSVNVNSNAVLTFSNVLPGSGTLSSIVATLDGVPTTCTLGAATCNVLVPSNAPNGAAVVVVTATNSQGGSTTKSVSITVTGNTQNIDNPTAQITRIAATNTARVVATAGNGATFQSVVVTVTKNGVPVGNPIQVAGANTSLDQNVDFSAAISGVGNYVVSLLVTNSVNLSASSKIEFVETVPNPSFTATLNPSTVTVGQSTTLTIANAVAGSGTISSISTSLNGGAAVPCTNLTGNGNCTVVVPTGTTLGAASLVVTTTNSDGGSSTRTLSINVQGLPVLVQPNASVTRIGTTNTAQVVANAGNGATLTSVVLTIAKPDGTTKTIPVPGVVTSGINSVVDYSSEISGPGTYVVSLLVTNSTNQTATSSFPFDVAPPVVVVPPPPLQGGGDNNGGSINPFSDAALFAFNRATQFTYLVVDQQDSVGTGGGTNLGGSQRLTYVRGTIPIQQLFRIAFASSNINIPATAIISLENTTNGAVNTLGAVTSLDTFSLNQGEEYLVVARNNPSNGGGLIEIGRARIVPDNQSPQTPRVKRVSELSEQLTSAYGYWIRGFDQTPRLELINTPELDDNPQRPGGVGGLPGSKIKPAVGIRHIRYYAVPATNGDPGAVVDLSRLAGVTATANGTAPAGSRLIKVVDFNDLGGAGGGAYPAQFATRLTPNQTNLTQLADGKYVVFAVSVDYLGNVSKLDFADSFILGVDTLAPGGNISVRDRGPLDVQASGALCDRVNIATRRIDAPSDIYPALYFNAGSAIPSDLNIPATSQYGTVLRNGANFATDYAFVSGCALIGGNVEDVGVGFDGNNILGGGTSVGNIAPAGGFDFSDFFFTSPLAFQINPTQSGVGTFNSALSTARVVNMNNVSSSQLQGIGQIADLLGNAGPIYSNPYLVDNRAPNITYSGAAANGSNTFTRWFNFGFQVNVEDQISGLRYDAGSFDKGISFFYGTDPINNDSVDDTVVGAYNNTLIQVDPSRLERTRADQQSATYGTNLNLPLPNFDYTAGRFVGGNLNLWTVSADRAGNARGALRQIGVTGSSSLPVDLQTDLGTLEDGSNTPYRGFTALNRSNAGLVPRGTFDQLDPLLPNSDTSPSSALYAPLDQYGILPNPGNNATPWYELRLANTPENQFRGDTTFTKGVGRVTFAYRLPDPVVYAGQQPEQVNNSTVIHINPATYWTSSVYNYQARSGTGVLLSSQARTGTLNGNPIYQLSGDPAFTTQAACETFFTNKVRCLQLRDSVTYNTSGPTAFLGASQSDFVVPGTPGTVVRKNGANEPLFFPVVLNSSADNARDIARKGRFMYNLPEWMGGQTASAQNPLQDNQYIGYIWNTIGQDVTPQGSTNGQGLEPFSAIFDARLGLGQYVLGEDLINFPNGATNPNAFNVDGTSLFGDCTPVFTVANPGNTVCKTGGISVLAYNNYGAFDAQTKSIVSFPVGR